MKEKKVDIQHNGHYAKVTYSDDVKSVIVSGDIHGDFSGLVFKVCCQYEITDALVIVAGDCGFGFERYGAYEQIYKKNLKRLRKNNIYILFIRGNHDNPAYFNLKKISWERFLAVPDYTVVNAVGKTILTVGGAVSVDRQTRYIHQMTHPVSHYHDDAAYKPDCYWPGEIPYYNEDLLDIITKQEQIDTVVTHTAPSFCEFSSKDGLKNWAKSDSMLISDVERERQTIDNILCLLQQRQMPIKDWVYGHFHSSWHSSINNIMYTMLDISELKELH